MQFLCIVALLLPAVAARPDPRWPWQGKAFGGPGPDGNSQDPMGMHPPIEKPMDGNGGHHGPNGRGLLWPRWESGTPGSPIWPGERPPWYPHGPSGGPWNGDSQRPSPGDNGGNQQPEGVPPNPDRGDKRTPNPGNMPPHPGIVPPHLENMPDRAGAANPGQGQRPPRGPGSRWGRFRAPPRGGGRPNRKPGGRIPPFSPGGEEAALFEGIFFGGNPLNPNMVGNGKFIPIFKADNVTFQNVTGLPLTEGEKIYLLPKGPPRGPPHPMEGQHEPQRMYGGFGLQPYLKIVYNPTATNKVSFEYGIYAPLPMG